MEENSSGRGEREEGAQHSSLQPNEKERRGKGKREGLDILCDTKENSGMMGKESPDINHTTTCYLGTWVLFWGP